MIDLITIMLDAKDRPSKRASEYFKQKGIVPSWGWTDLAAEAHAGAFTVAKAMCAEVLTSLKDGMQKALDSGQTYAQFLKEMEPILQRAGWWGRAWPRDNDGNIVGPDRQPFEPGPDDVPPMLGSPWRLRVIYQTNCQVAMNVGRYEGMMQVAEQRPYWQYIAIGDANTTALCNSLNGSVFRYDDPFWSAFFPPNHWGCRSSVRSLSQREIDRDKLTVSVSEGKIQKRYDLASKKTGVAVMSATVTVNGRSFSPSPGWAGNPGMMHHLKLIDHMFRRLSSVDSDLGEAELLDFMSSEEYRAAFRGWVDQHDESISKVWNYARGVLRPVSVLPNVVCQTLANAGIVLNSPIVVISDDRIIHAIRSIHSKKKESAISAQELASFPVLFQSADHCIIESTQKKGHEHPQVLLFWDSADKAKKRTKVVINLDPLEYSRITTFLNVTVADEKSIRGTSIDLRKKE